MKNKIVFWLGSEFTHFSLAYYLQDMIDADFHAIVDITNKPKLFFQQQQLVKFRKTWYFHDHIKKTQKEPDLEYLKKIEIKYNVDLWKLAINERQFYRFFNFHKFTREEILSILEQECRLFESILDEIKPDYFITKEASRHNLQLFSEMCRAVGVSVLALSTTKIGYRSMITQDSTKFDGVQDLGTIECKDRTFEQLQSYLKSFDAAKQIGDYVKKHGKSKFALLKAAFRFLFINDNKNIETHYNYFGRTKLNVLSYMLVLSVKKRYRERFINRNLRKEISADSPFVYFPLGVDMERNLLITAPFYTNQIEIIRHIVKSLPVNYKLFVKENPAQSSREWRSISEYEEIMNIPNVTLIHPKTPSEKLLKNCSLVITISGSSGFEAAFYEKPSIILSDTVYSILPSVHRLKSPEELPEAIRKSLTKKVSSHDLAKYIEILEKNSFEFDWLGFGARFKKHFYFDGGLVDVEITPSKMKSFLEENKPHLEKLALEHVKKMNEYRADIKPMNKRDV